MANAEHVVTGTDNWKPVPRRHHFGVGARTAHAAKAQRSGSGVHPWDPLFCSRFIELVIADLPSRGTNHLGNRPPLDVG